MSDKNPYAKMGLSQKLSDLLVESFFLFRHIFILVPLKSFLERDTMSEFDGKKPGTREEFIRLLATAKSRERELRKARGDCR